MTGNEVSESELKYQKAILARFLGGSYSLELQHCALIFSGSQIESELIPAASASNVRLWHLKCTPKGSTKLISVLIYDLSQINWEEITKSDIKHVFTYVVAAANLVPLLLKNSGWTHDNTQDWEDYYKEVYTRALAALPKGISLIPEEEALYSIFNFDYLLGLDSSQSAAPFYRLILAERENFPDIVSKRLEHTYLTGDSSQGLIFKIAQKVVPNVTVLRNLEAVCEEICGRIVSRDAGHKITAKK